ncbi:MAG: tetratricopeptide repeat protein [Candidatus Omnitrophota bacterium]
MNSENFSIQDNPFYQKGISALRKNNYAYAVELFQEVLKTNPDSPECLHNLWTAIRESNKTSKSSIFNMLFKQTKILTLNFKLIFLLLKNNPDPAITVLQKIILLNPDNISAFYKLATLFIQQQKRALAKVSLEEALLINNNNLKVLAELAQLYLQDKDYQKAKLIAQMLLKINPHHLEAENILKNIAAFGVMEEGFDNP